MKKKTILFYVTELYFLF